MLRPHSIWEKMLEVEKLNYRRQCCSLFSLSSVTLLFVLLAVSQSGLLSFLGDGIKNFWIALDFFSVLVGLLSLSCALLLVFKIEKRKRRIQRLLNEESRLNFSRIEGRKDKLDKVSDFFERYANTVDMIGTSCTTGMQVVALGFLLAGISVSNIYKVGSIGLGLNHIIDLIGNVAFFVSITMFALSHVIIHRKKDKSSQNFKKQTSIMLALFIGNALVLGGKAVVALESINIVINSPLASGGTFPLGWLMRSVGIALCTVAVCLIMLETGKKCRDLQRMIDVGEESSRKVLSLLSTHEVRSCFGFRECVAQGQRGVSQVRS